MKEFKSGHRRAQFVFLIFGILILLSIISIVILAIDIDIRQQIINGDGVSQSEQEDSNDRVALIGKIWMYTSIFGAVPFLLWLYRAHGNLSALGAKDLKFSTENAVAWFFAPIFNLFKPYQVASEIWNGSMVDDTNETQDYSSSAAFVGHWWGHFLLTLVAAILALIVFQVDLIDYSDTYAGYIEYLDDFVYYRYWSIAFLVIASGSFFSTMLFVGFVDRRQKTKHKLVKDLTV